MRALLLTVMLTACVDDGTTIADTCGPAPVFPEFSTAIERLDNGRLLVAITTDAYGQLVKYRLDAIAWQECAGGM